MLKMALIQSHVLDALKQIPDENLNLTNTLIYSMREYLAGLIDGEGTIYIKKTTYRIRNQKYSDCVNPQYYPVIQVKLTIPTPLLYLKKKYGGTLYKEKRIYKGKNSFESRKIIWVYQATHKISIKILTDIYPFLIIKKENAQCLLELIKLKNKVKVRTYPKELIRKFEGLYLKIKELNRGLNNENDSNARACSELFEKNP